MNRPHLPNPPHLATTVQALRDGGTHLLGYAIDLPCVLVNDTAAWIWEGKRQLVRLLRRH